jgi:activator of HSP90 ATPase
MKPFGVILQAPKKHNRSGVFAMLEKAAQSLRGYASKRRQIITGGALAFAGAALPVSPLRAGANDEISRAAESIHQERRFNAGRKRIYDALTVTKQFDKITQLTGVMQSAGMAKMQKPTEISPHRGGPFALFGGYITGRQIELLPDELIVQAWRAGSWGPGVYSIARFELVAEHASTKIIFDHAGFPQGEAEHLASGWQEHYWDPLAKYLA